MASIYETLKDCPKGTRLYSPICGECWLHSAEDGVITVTDNGGAPYSFYKDGMQHPTGECLLFPSKENRDWGAFTHTGRFKKGGFPKGTRGNAFIRGESVRTPPKHVENPSRVLSNDGPCAIGDWPREGTIAPHANEEEKQKLIAAIDEKGYIWDSEKLELRKKEPEFKPFDKVLVRDDVEDIWRLAQYGFESEDNPAYAYNTVGGTWWAHCIPYEGNEHLLGTTENCK